MPSATPAAVRKQIAQGALAPVYLIVGDDEAEMSRLAADLSAVVEDELRAFNVERIYATDKSASSASIAEAARLLPGATAESVQSDRRAAVRALAARYGAFAIWKGPHTLVATPSPDEPLRVCDRGNPGMATGGTGDVLSGVLGSLLVQTGSLELAAYAGVLLHALAGDAAAQDGERGTVAGDLLPHLRAWANPS